MDFIEKLPSQPERQYEPEELQKHLDIYNSYCQVAQAKQAVMSWGNSGHGDVKKLISQYLYYITNRSAGDKLIMGRDICQCAQRETYPEHLQRMSERRVILALHDYRCVMCGELNTYTTKLEIHHIEKLSASRNRDITNLAPLCHKCHCEAHAGDPTVWRN